MIAKIKLAAIAVIGSSFLALGAWGQEGFPLDGTWRAYLPNERTVVLIMKWDGEVINGMINPGRNSSELQRADLDPGNWGVRIQSTDIDGSTVTINGTLVDVGSYNRKIVGTWSQSGEIFDVEIRRE